MAPSNSRDDATWPGGASPDAGDETLYAEDQLSLGKKLDDRYLIEKELGRGGIGVVYLARDTRLHSMPVVVKVLLDVSDQNEWLRKKFRQESEALSRINHNGVVRVLNIGEVAGGKPYLVMEFIEGVSLRAAMGGEWMALSRVAHIMRQVGRALSAAHGKGVYHRDLKPENIMLQDAGDDDDHVKLIDFGVAKIKDSRIAASTNIPMVAGTIAYMAPEQLMGSPSASSDIYVMGVIAYEMVTGRRPFVPDTTVQFLAMQQMLEMQQQGVSVKPKDLRRSLPEAAQEVILKALSFEAGKRQPRAQEFGDDLARALSAESAPVVEPPHPPTPPPPGPTPTGGSTEPTWVEEDETPSRVMAHVLFMDIVKFGKLPMDKQARQTRLLNEIVSATDAFRQAHGDQLIPLPTGDGMALVFFGDPVAPVHCAVEVSRQLRRHEELRLRMGVHTGPVSQVRDISANRNVAGGGIIIAERVMSCGDAGHILVSRAMADILMQLSVWDAQLHDLGEIVIKHEDRVQVFNLYGDDFGNPEPPEPPAPSPTDKSILIQTLGVSHYRNIGGEEGLMYALAPLGGAPKESVFVPVRGQGLQKHIEDIRRCVEDLTRLALAGQRWRGDGLEAAAGALARHVLPARGLVGMLGPGVHPQFDLIQDAASEIPWELLEERYFTCPNCHQVVLPNRQTEAEQARCGRCRLAMSPAGGKLSLTYHLTHLARGVGRSGGEGNRFLFIEDPGADLCDSRFDRERLCAGHLTRLRELVGRQGFNVETLRHGEATVRRVLRELADTSVIGVYYFGRGLLAPSDDKCCLLLADGPLFAQHLIESAPTAKFVFLNVCGDDRDSGGPGGGEGLGSVAKAFARGGGGKIVIAPLWPLVSVQAAETALEFFQHASTSAPLGEALRGTRLQSLRRFEDGEPHLSWMAYRYFGDPNRPLPTPTEFEPPGVHVVTPEPAGRVFDGGGQLDTELFAFAVDQVLLRAAKRRNWQERRYVSVTDFLAGLVRRGDLTRFVLRRAGVNADELYVRLEQSVETEPAPFDGGAGARRAGADTGGGRRAGDALGGNLAGDLDEMSEEELRALLSKWIIRDREDLKESLIDVLERADRLAQSRPAQAQDQGRRISEQDVLESLLDDASWSKVAPQVLPSADEVRRQLRERERSGEVDENGVISLKALDADARRVIETAHVLAQQRGTFPIPNRLMLAAFLSREGSHGEQAIRRAGHDPKLLFDVMIATFEVKDGTPPTPLSFGLSEEACERIVLPVIERAGRGSTGGGPITERDLFEAFRAEADANFKGMLKSPPLNLDLENLNVIVDPPPRPRLSPEARRVVETAHELAQQSGAFPIPNRLILAAFLNDADGPVATLFERRGLPSRQLANQLILWSDRGGRRAFDLNAEACARAVTPMLERAFSATPSGVVSAETLFKAFCEVTDPEFKKALRSSSLRIDLDALGSEVGAAATAGVVGGGGSVPPAGQPPRTGAGELSVDWFTEGAWRVLVEADRLARLQGWAEIRTPHLYAAMLGDVSVIAGAALRREGLNPQEVRNAVLSIVPLKSPSPLEPGGITLGQNAGQVIARARELAAAKGLARVGEDELFAALFADGGGVLGEVLERLGARVAAEWGRAGVAAAVGGPAQGESVLAAFGEDLTERARAGQLPEIVARDAEIETAMRTLRLFENANPLLVGEAGVGKTAIVEGIAQRIAEGRCHEQLRSMRVVEISAGSLLADAIYRGKFEERVRRMLAEARSNVILFIDEIHTIVKAGAGEGGIDAGNLLKTALARGEVRLIGATTHEEFKQTIARDRALSRRFQVQHIAPPTREATCRILDSRQQALERHHHVIITEEAKTAAVDLSGRYIGDGRWPAKARDALELACTFASEAGAAAGVPPRVTAEHVARAVSQQSGLPLERVSVGELGALSDLEERLNRRVVGQGAAVRVVADAIRRGRRGLSDANRPWGTFLFVGPSGVGKTELAKVLAEEVFGGAEGLVRFDMGDFSEPHSTAKLVGAPPGYAGYFQGAPLVERLRTHPYSLLLFDEVEHAHENVLGVLLRLLSEGTLSDAEGNPADARNTIVILTSNLLSEDPEGRQPGFTAGAKSPQPPAQAELRTRLNRLLPSKLIDRMDAVVRFNPLAPTDLEVIAAHKVADLVARVEALGSVRVRVGPEVPPWLARRAAGEGTGARAVQRAVDSYLAAPLSAVCAAAPPPGAVIALSVADDKIRVEEVSAGERRSEGESHTQEISRD